jgi:CheY-like chemotaxis protein
MEPPLNRCKVLVVEDEYFIADDIAVALRQLGAEVLGPAPSRDDALALISRARRIDLGILDVNLRGEDVFPIAQALNDRKVPFAFATGYERSALPARFQGIPCWQKPFQPEELAAALPGLFASKQPH